MKQYALNNYNLTKIIPDILIDESINTLNDHMICILLENTGLSFKRKL